jgi:flagellar hook-associated protein 1 FlgK
VKKYQLSLRLEQYQVAGSEMSGLSGAVSTALTGLEAFVDGISTVSQNVANQTTAGYAQENLNLSTIDDAATDTVGNGVQGQVARVADGFSAGILRTANSASTAASTTSSALTSISNSLTNNGDVQIATNQFFLDVGTLAANPTSDAQQQTVNSDAQSVTDAFQSAAGSITAAKTGATTSLSDEVSTVNNLLGQLQDVNQGLVTSPNNVSLLDQQEATLASLSNLLSVNVVPTGSNGEVLLASGGTVLLNQAGVQALNLTGGTGSVAPTISVGISGVTLSLAANDGAIGGNLQTWHSGAAALQSLNSLAGIFSSQVNTAQAQGLTTTGAQGGAIFSVPSPTVVASSTNTGSASLSAQITDAGTLPTDGGPFLLSYSSTSGWSAEDQATGSSYGVTAGSSLSFAGLSVSLSGAPQNGDSFTVDPAPGAATSIAVTTALGSSIAAADPYAATPGALQPDGSVSNTNAGSVEGGTTSVTATVPLGATVIPANYYGQSLQVVFTSTSSYDVTTAANPTAVIASGSLSGTTGASTIAVAYPTTGNASGTYWELPISGAPATGDKLTLTAGGSGSGTNATRIQALWTTAGSTAAGTLQEAVVGLGTSLGANAQQAQDLATGTAAQVTTATSNLQTLAGVSLNQQAVLLTQYQQAFQAAAQVITTADAMFQSLLQAV